MHRRKRHNFLFAKRFFRKKDTGLHSPSVKGAVITLVLALSIAGLMILPFWLMSVRVYAHVDAGRSELAAAQAAAGRLEFTKALIHTDAAEDRFVSARGELDRFMPFVKVPLLGPHIDAADRLLASGTVAISALHDVMSVGQDILDVLRDTEGLSGLLSDTIPDPATVFTDLTKYQKGLVLEVFANSAPRIRVALDKVDGARISLDTIIADGSVAVAFRDSLHPIREKLDMLHEGLGLLLPATEILPTLLGHPDTKTYLIFFQNNTELRPTGGFLGVVGLVSIEDGELENAVTSDVYALDGPSETEDRPVPPAPIQKYIGIDRWYLRDANWSPDFTEAVDVMERFFVEEAAIALGGIEAVPEIDGVIAVTPKVASDVLQLTGPITVEGIEFTAENLVDELEYQVEKGFVRDGIPRDQRKDIVGTLMEEMIARVSSFSLEDLRYLAQGVLKNLQEGHILLSMSDAKLQRVVLENDWGGRLHDVRGDYLLVVDANLASLKSDPAVMRTIGYAIEPELDGGYTGRVTVTYDHQGSFDWKTTRYRTYTRLYVPEGTELIRVEGAMENDRLKDPARRPGVPDIYDELGRRAFGAFISTEPGEIRSLTFVFSLAPSVVESIERGAYALYVEKQPGTLAHGLTLDLNFGKTFIGAEPPEPHNEFGDTRYRAETDLRTDREFKVEF